ncbi:AraC family transcriptional regulator [Frateuria sp.]|uniref:AraC family transcriptional regulator n=1 Tax=Frateuria sp. TaxID=2211372 RepID=UPI0025BA3E4E|nr:AraC family transcriptional regulator [Frateuria sp.]
MHGDHVRRARMLVRSSRESGLDTLSELLRHLRLDTRVFHREVHCGAWSLDAEYEPKAMFHLVAAGQCLLETADGRVACRLEAGDAVLFARQASHRLRSVPASTYEDATVLLCGYFEFASPLSQVLLASLPPLLVFRARDEDADGGSAAMLFRLILAETAHPSAGGGALLDKLADALFVYAVRHALSEGQVTQGVLRGLLDAQLAPALLRIHRQLQVPLKVEDLAREVHLSRAAFARRFREIVGLPPIAYMTALKLQAGQEALQRRGVSVAKAAEIAGYATEAAFSRAYHRVFGRTPGSERRPATGRRRTRRGERGKRAHHLS